MILFGRKKFISKLAKATPSLSTSAPGPPCPRDLLCCFRGGDDVFGLGSRRTQHGAQAHANGVRCPTAAARALDGALAVQAVVGLGVRHAVLFVEQVGRLVWQPVVQLRKSQFDFSVFTV